MHIKIIFSYNKSIAKYKKEVARFTNLVKSNAANQKQLDDVKAAYNAALKKRTASLDTMQQNNKVIENEVNGLKIQIAQIDDNIEKSYIIRKKLSSFLSKFIVPKNTRNCPFRPI